MPLSRILTFATIATTLTASLHYYFWTRLVRDTAMPQPWRTVATAVLVLLCASLPMVLLMNRLLPGPLVRTLQLPAYVWMGTMLLLLFSLVGADLVRLALAAARAISSGGGVAPGPPRRALFPRTPPAPPAGPARRGHPRAPPRRP